MYQCACRYVQVEYGPMELDLNLRVRIFELEKHLAEQVIFTLRLTMFLTQYHLRREGYGMNLLSVKN